MEILFVLKKKFSNGHVVRKIYEFATEERKYWLKQYRYAISNGYNIPYDWLYRPDKKLMNSYCFRTDKGKNGISSFTLRSRITASRSNPGLSHNRPYTRSVKLCEIIHQNYFGF